MGELEILYQAVGSPLGLVVKTSNFQLAQQRFYKARADSGDPDLTRLQFRHSPYDPNDLWIVKGPKPNAEA